MSKGPGTSRRGSAEAALASLPQVHFGGEYEIQYSEDKAAYDRSEALKGRLDSMEIRALDRYTEEGFAGIRAALTGGTGATERDHADAAILRVALQKAPKVEQVVYRGMAVNERTLGQMLRSRRIEIDSPASTSRDVGVAQYFLRSSHNTDNRFGVLLRLRQRSGASIDTISSMGGSEREVLLPIGTRLKIDRVRRTSVENSNNRIPTLVIYATEI